jgi:phage baseplate assembly protein W
MALENPRTASVRQRDNDPDSKIGIIFPIRNSKDGFFASSTSILEQTKTNLKNLLLTVKGERLGQPEFGSEIFNLLFENFDPDLEKKLEASIKDSIEEWLPHVHIINLIIDAQEDKNYLSISLSYEIEGSHNATDSISLRLARNIV